MELERGYLEREDMPIGPRVFTDHLLEAFAGTLADALGDGDGVLFSIQHTIAGNVADGLDAKFSSTIGSAEDAAANNAGAGDDQTAGALVDTGGNVDVQRESSLPYLPQSDAPIVGDFRELPDFGEGHVGGGGVTGAPETTPQEL